MSLSHGCFIQTSSELNYPNLFFAVFRRKIALTFPNVYESLDQSSIRRVVFAIMPVEKLFEEGMLIIIVSNVRKRHPHDLSRIDFLVENNHFVKMNCRWLQFYNLQIRSTLNHY